MILCHPTWKKLIIYTNTASQAETYQDKVNTLLDNELLFEGDTVLIIGGLEPEVKLINAQTFTKEIHNAAELIENNEFFPRVLIATSSSIGAGLGLSDVYSVIRIGFPTSILDLMQEMGRYGRNQMMAEILQTYSPFVSI